MPGHLSPPENDTSKPVLSKVQALLLEAKNSRRSPTLNTLEERWRDRYDFLVARGYKLRPRYRPGWKGSWLQTTKSLSECEDAIDHIPTGVLDATRVADGMTVCIKRVKPREINDGKDEKDEQITGLDEVEVARFLSSPGLQNHNHNHSVSILDSFQDPSEPMVRYLVMPLLRPFDDPAFGEHGEVIDFIDQILEGMEFMHSRLVAHGDLTSPNIMMDARPILPQGWHFVRTALAPNGVDPIYPLPRLDYPVRYIIIDYDNSVRFRPGQSHLIDLPGGRDQEVPELKRPRGGSGQILPYDAFKLDVFTVGNLFSKEFQQQYCGLDLITDLTDIMMISDFRHRCTAQDALKRWSSIKSQSYVHPRRRLRKRDESVGDRVFNAINRWVQSGCAKELVC